MVALKFEVVSTRIVPLKTILNMVRESKLDGLLTVEGDKGRSKLYFMKGLPVAHEGSEDLIIGILEGKIDAKASFEPKGEDELYNEIKGLMKTVTTDISLEFLDRRKLSEMLSKEPGVYILKVDGHLIITYGATTLYRCVDDTVSEVGNLDDAFKGIKGRLTIIRGDLHIVSKILSLFRRRPPIPSLRLKI